MVKTLIIDDDIISINKIRRIVEENNMIIQIEGFTSDDTNAINLIEKKNPKLIFIDTKMTLIKKMKIIKQLKVKNIIFMTEQNTFEIAQKAIRLGANDIILKPIEYKNLEESINRVIGYDITSNSIVNDIIKYIDFNYKNKINLKIISEEFFMNSDYISRIFKSYMGISIIKYINKVRIYEAKKLLVKNKYTLNEISMEVGYENLNNFYRNFKSNTSMTPYEFLKIKNNKYLL